MSTAPTTLLHFRVSHFNEKVRWALDHKGWPHRREALRPGLHARRVTRLTGQAKVPVLRIGDEILHGSARIIDELERRQPEPALYPADPAERARALALQAHFDEEVAPELRRLFWSTYVASSAATARVLAMGFGGGTRALYRTLVPLLRRRFRDNIGLGEDALARARERLPGHLDRIERELGPSGYLVGDRFTVADLAVASIMSAIVRPPEFPYPLPEWSPGLLELREQLAARPGYRWVLDVYARHRGGSAEV
jgi:glutathione S-transferase